jgi:hypothetical protein
MAADLEAFVRQRQRRRRPRRGPTTTVLSEVSTLLAAMDELPSFLARVAYNNLITISSPPL